MTFTILLLVILIFMEKKLTLSTSIEKGEEEEDAMTALFGNVSLDTENSETETDSDDDELEPDQFEEKLCPYFPGNRRLGLRRLTNQPSHDTLSVLNPAGRILRKFRGSLDTAVELAIGLEDDDPVKMELLQALHHHLCLLKEDVKDNLKQTLLSGAIVEELEEQSEQGSNGGEIKY